MKPIDFCKRFSQQTGLIKENAIKQLKVTLEIGKNQRGTIMKENERVYVEQLLRWCEANVKLGNQLCPPEHLTKY